MKGQFLFIFIFSFFFIFSCHAVVRLYWRDNTFVTKATQNKQNKKKTGLVIGLSLAFVKPIVGLIDSCLLVDDADRLAALWMNELKFYLHVNIAEPN